MKMSCLPNFLSLLRLFLAPVLLLFPFAGGGFLLLYALCGLTDLLDGFLARRFGWQSGLGARLDSAADFALMAVLLLRLWPLVASDALLFVLILANALLRFAAAAVAKVRFGRFGFLHTWGNKLTGGLLFLYPFTLAVTNTRSIPLLLGAVALVTALEELLTECRLSHFIPDCRGLFDTKQNHNHKQSAR